MIEGHWVFSLTSLAVFLWKRTYVYVLWELWGMTYMSCLLFLLLFTLWGIVEYVTGHRLGGLSPIYANARDTACVPCLYRPFLLHTKVADTTTGKPAGGLWITLEVKRVRSCNFHDNLFKMHEKLNLHTCLNSSVGFTILGSGHKQTKPRRIRTSKFLVTKLNTQSFKNILIELIAEK